MSALTELVPLSPPMVRLTCTGFMVPVKLAPLASASNAYRKVPVRLISASSFTPSMTPWKLKDPPSFSPSCFLKEPGGIVMEKVPTSPDCLPHPWVAFRRAARRRRR